MTGLRKIIKWASAILLLVSVLLVSGFVFYLETSIDKIMSDKKRAELLSDINNSPEIPESFYQSFHNYYPDAFEQNVWTSILNQVVGGKRNQCQCREIYIHPGYTDHWIEFTQPIVALEIEEHCSAKKCFEYNMSVSDFGMNIKGIQAAAKTFYEKNLDDLSEREVIELMIIHKSPIRYNPFIQRENLNQAVNRIINKN